MKSRHLLTISCLLLLCTSSPAANDVLGWLKENIFGRIRVSGYKTFGYHNHTVTGDRQTFNELNYRGQGGKTFTDDGDVLISGQKVLGLFTFDVHVNSNRFAQPLDRRFSLNFERKNIKADIGDINAALHNTNPLISIRRSMQGAQVETQIGNLSVRALASRSKSSARTITINGNNSAGPYYVQGSQLVDGTLRVRVDGNEMALGQDYTASLETGTITFLGRIIPPTSVIVVTYETRGINQSRGDVIGGSANLKITDNLSMGITHVVQQPRGDGTLRAVTEEFEGFGSPNTPYFLLQPPLRERPIIVTVDNILQAEGVDYYFDANNPLVFYFTRFMPATSIIRVTYFPTPDPGSFGNGRRQVQGVDLNWKIGEQGRFSVAAARSSLETPLGKQNGQAFHANVNIPMGRLGVQATYKHIPSSYISIESTGFYRNESGSDINLSYDAGKGYTFNLKNTNIRLGTPTYTGNGLKTVTGKSQDTTFTADYKPHEKEHYFMSASSFSGEYNNQPSSSKSITAGWRRNEKNWTTQIDLNRQQASAPIITSTGPAGTINATISGARISQTYRASEDLNLSARVGYNVVKTHTGSSQGRDISLSANYQPSEKMSLDLTWADLESGAITEIGGFQGGAGFGYNGNSFSSGAFGFGGNSGTTRSKVLQLTARWKPTSNFSLDVYANRSTSEGSNLTNSKSEGIGVRTEWSPTQKTSISADLTQQQVQFTTSPGSSTTTIVNLGVSHAFTERLRFYGAYTRSLFGGSGLSGFQQDIDSVNANLNYKLDQKQFLIAEYNRGNTYGYLADYQSYLGIGYGYEILPGVNLIAAYRIRERQNLTAQNASNSYKSAGFDIELRLNFRN